MIGVVLVALAVVRGAPWGVAVIVAAAIWQPALFMVGVAVWTLWGRLQRAPGGGPSAEADFLRGMAAELAAGASLRGALVAAADRAEALDMHRAVRVAAAGLPAGDIGDALRPALPHNGRLAAAAFRLAADTGGRAAGIMTTLAARADDIGSLARERRALTAQARLSAWIVGGGPLLVVAALGATGRLGALLGDPTGRVVLAVGGALEAIGSGIVVLMVRRAGR